MAKKVIDFIDKDLQQLAKALQPYLNTFANSVILTSANGTKYRVIVANDGTLSTQLVS